MDLNDKNVIVTGGARGIGKNLVLKLIEEGANVGVFDIDVEGLKRLESDYSDLTCIQCDLTNYKQVEKSIDDFYNEYNRIDVLVNNAGILYSAPLISITPEGIKKHDIETWNNVLKIDLNSVFYMTVNVVEKMIKHRTKGCIVNISSISASGNAGQSAYSAAKAAVNALTATWAKELSLWGIRVVAIAPGFTDTASTREVMKEDVLKDVIREVPLRRLGNVEEITDGIIFVLKNEFFNGKVISLDGGLII